MGSAMCKHAVFVHWCFPHAARLLQDVGLVLDTNNLLKQSSVPSCVPKLSIQSVPTLVPKASPRWRSRLAVAEVTRLGCRVRSRDLQSEVQGGARHLHLLHLQALCLVASILRGCCCILCIPMGVVGVAYTVSQLGACTVQAMCCGGTVVA